jgi:hypothetical protein
MTLDADSLTARDLFEKQVRYVIPTFQRPYVWNQEDQWEPFWEDVQHAADRYLEELGDEGASAAEAEKRAGRHFLGAVVVKQQLNAAAEVETREVIDGQQRLTTMQLLLDAAEAVARESGWDDASEVLHDLVLNKSRYAKKDPDFIFKLWPTTTDQDAFRAVMSNNASHKEFAKSQVVQAHEYFQLRVRDWVDYADAPEERLARMEALSTALVGLLEIVIIDLGSADDAFIIFETLNARGTPLLASDLVKNMLLQTASAHGHEPEIVSSEFWKQFDDEWWRQQVRQGRLRRPRVDTYLDYWLEAATGQEVASHEIFPTFKALVDNRPSGVLDIAADMKEMAHVYRQLDDLDRFTPDGTFLYRWEVVDARVLTPLLMWVFKWSSNELASERRTRLLQHLESYLVRRMLNRLTSKQYNRMFLEALKELIEAGPASADDTLIAFLAKQTADSQLWPSDTDMCTAFLDVPAYRLLSRGRVRIVLEALEDDRRGPKSENQHCARHLTVEHVLPQTWETHWPLPDGVEPLQARLDRDRLLHTLGNLTLATNSLNSSMSNHAWEHKREHLTENSVMHLNKRILSQAEAAGRWDEAAIRDRGLELFEQAKRIWPRPA